MFKRIGVKKEGRREGGKEGNEEEGRKEGRKDKEDFGDLKSLVTEKDWIG